MKQTNYLLRLRSLLAIGLLCTGFSAIAQDSTMQFFRPTNKKRLECF